MTGERPTPLIYLITQGEARPDTFDTDRLRTLNTIRIAVEEKIPLVQVREKRITTLQLFQLASEAALLVRNSNTRLMVNDRADVAAAAGADGVHLTSTSLSVEAIKRAFPKLAVGVSTHEPSEILAARSEGAGFALFGPVFSTPSKKSSVGIKELTKVCEMADPFPVIAIGGIDESNFRSVLDAGAAGFAAIRSLNDPDKLRSMARTLL